MKKQTFRYLLFLLPALLWPTVFFANSDGNNSATLAAITDTCPAPPPDWIITTNVTPTSISLQWQAAQVNLHYRVRVEDLTDNISLPTRYTSTPFITVDSLPSGHDFRFYVSTSRCPGEGYGTERDHDESTSIIIVDIIVGLQDPCSPTSTKTTGNGVSHNFCVLQSTSSNPPPYNNGFVGRIQYNGSNLNFGIALDGYEVHAGKISGSQLFTFEATNGDSEAVCKYDGTPLFTIENLNFDNSFDQINFTITFEGNYGNLSFCTNCTGTGGSKSGGVGTIDGGVEFAAPNVIRTPKPIPNPFSESTIFRYELTESGPVEISLYDATGRLVQVEKVSAREPGQYEATIDGAGLPDGVYFLSVLTGQQREVFKLVKRE